MAKQVLKGHIYWQQNKYMKSPKFVFEHYDMREWSEESKDGRVWIREHTMEVDVPDDFDPRPSMIEGLRKEKEKARTAYVAMVKEIDDRINSLLALEMSA